MLKTLQDQATTVGTKLSIQCRVERIGHLINFTKVLIKNHILLIKYILGVTNQNHSIDETLLQLPLRSTQACFI